MTNKEIAEKLNIGLKTVYTWKETRPELMHYLQLGIEFEEIKKIAKKNSKEEELENKDYKIYVYITKKYCKYIESIIKTTDEEFSDSGDISDTILYSYIKFIEYIKKKRIELKDNSFQYGYKNAYMYEVVNFIKEENITLFRIDDLLKINEENIIFIENYIIDYNNKIFDLLQIFDKRICFIHLLIFLFINKKITIDDFQEMYQIRSETEMLKLFEKENITQPFFG